MRVRAPGKALLCGEYAVLRGAPAVVTAISRYACAALATGATRTPSPFIAQARRCASAYLATRGLPLPSGTPSVDSRALAAESGEKLGLGSSAAVTTASAVLLLAAAGCDLDDATTRSDLLALADEAHRAAQEGMGSGADIAASVYGGVLQVLRLGDAPPQTRPLRLPEGLTLAFFWTGRAASTPRLIEQVLAASVDREMGALGELAHEFAAAFARADVSATIAAAARYERALGALGAAAACEIVTPAHARLAELALRRGGAAKPSGAGGGDLAIAFLPDAATADALRRDARPLGLQPLDLTLDSTGAHMEHDA